MKYKLPNGKEVSVWKNADGYLMCKMNGKNKPIHRAVYELEIDPIPKGLTINHIDGDKYNNNISNLEIMTFSENAKHAWRNGLARPCRGEKHGRSILDDIKVLTIITCPKRAINGRGPGITNKELSDLYGVSITRIFAIRNGKEWKCIHDAIRN